MVKETEINLPKSLWPSGYMETNNRLVQIGRAGRGILGYMYEADSNHIYIVSHHSASTPSARTVEIPFANGTAVTALVLLRDPTRGIAVFAANRTEDYVSLPADWTATANPVQTGDTVSLVTWAGSIKAQVLEANWMLALPDGRLEVRGIAGALASRLALAYSGAYQGDLVLTWKGGFFGFVDGSDPETRSTIVVNADGFYRIIRDVKEKFTKFTSTPGNSFDDLFKDPAKYDRMRTALAPTTLPTFLGIENFTVGSGRNAIHIITSVPDSINIKTGQIGEYTYRQGVEIPYPTPANSNHQFMADFNINRTTGYGKLASLSWIDHTTRQRVEIKAGDYRWEVALDLAAAKAGDTLRVEVQWVVNGGSTRTALYDFALNKSVEDRFPSSETFLRPLSQLSPFAGTPIAKYYRFLSGIGINTLDSFLAGQPAMAAYSGGGYVAYLNRPYSGPSMGLNPGVGYFQVWNKWNY